MLTGSCHKCSRPRRPSTSGSVPMDTFSDLLAQDGPALLQALQVLRVQGMSPRLEEFYARPRAGRAHAGTWGHRVSGVVVQLAPRRQTSARLGCRRRCAHVDEVISVLDGAPLCAFAMPEVWAEAEVQDGTERYWRKGADSGKGTDRSR